MKKFITLFIGVILLCAVPSSVLAEDRIRVAVAAHYIQTFNELAAYFQRKTSIKVEVTFSSSENLYSQITNGAPYDIFLSGDRERPYLLQVSGAAENPFTYATGRVVLWSAHKDFCVAENWRAALRTGSVKRISIVNPHTLPYGKAAKAAMVKTGIWETVKQRLVIAQTIAQAFQYASTEAVDAGFCALSAGLSVQGRMGCFYEIAEAPDIVHSACIIKKTKNRRAAERFSKFLVSPEADSIKRKYGYR